MILIQAAGQMASDFDAKVVFATQLAAQGYNVLIDETTAPEKLSRSRTYAAAPFLSPVRTDDVSNVVVIGAENISDDTLRVLRGYNLPGQVPVHLAGNFPTAQAALWSASQVAYATNHEPNIVNLTDLQPRPLIAPSVSPIFGVEGATGAFASDQINLFVYLPPVLLEDRANLLSLSKLAGHAGLKCNLLTNAKGIKLIREARYETIRAYNYLEFSPATLAQIADIAANFGPNKPAERIAIFAANLIQRGGIFVDCSNTGTLTKNGAPIMRGATDLGEFVSTFHDRIFSKRQEISQKLLNDPWRQQNALTNLENALFRDTSPPKKSAIPPPSKMRYIFLPTNGVGLGHAQRSSVIASGITPQSDCVFAASSSCIPMLRSKGFDCVPLTAKSDAHRNSFANDLFNYLKLRNFIKGTDQLIFDGGYIFDSIYRTLIENQLCATWIRRGLWQDGQANPITAERAHLFDQIIIPGEAFPELNAANIYDQKIHNVGPIVQQVNPDEMDSKGLRKQLQKRFDREFSQMAVTMLGAGFRGDRTQNLQIICNLFERQKNAVNLVVVWPNAVISPFLYGFRNTVVVKARNALALCMASDFVISATGYNSFHELLYHGIPAIFVPQHATLDDQERRARAASERDLAVTVPASELLLFEKTVSAFLNDGAGDTIRKQLQKYRFPATGNQSAAKFIRQGAPK